MKNKPILAEIANAVPTLRKSEVKVAEYVLAAPQHVMHMRIVDLAQEAQVSEPTIVRFCRAIGCNGFQEFKVRIAQEIAITNNIGHQGLPMASLRNSTAHPTSPNHTQNNTNRPP